MSSSVGKVIDINSPSEFDSIVAKHTCVVDYFATWCGPCVRLAPVLAELASANPTLKFLKVDVDRQPELKSRAGIKAMPTLHFMHQGRKEAEIVGAHMDQIQAKVTEFARKAQGGATFAGEGRRLGGSESKPTAGAAADAAPEKLVPALAIMRPPPPASTQTTTTTGAGDEDSVVTMFHSELVAMGFDAARARAALKATAAAPSIEAAVDWLMQHADDEAPPAPSAQPVVVVDDNDISDDEDDAALLAAALKASRPKLDVATTTTTTTTTTTAAAATTTTTTTPAADEVPYEMEGSLKITHDPNMTPERLELEKAKLAEKLKAIREAKQRQEERDKVERDKRSIAEAKAAAEAREQYQAKAAEREAALLKKEKDREREHAAAVRRQIALDKAERLAQAEAKKRAASGETMAPAAKVAATAPTSTPSASTAPTSSHTHCTIAIRLPSGETRQREFSATARVQEVASWAATEAGVKVSLMTTFPRVIYNTPQLLQAPLNSIEGMVPRGLFVATRGQQ